MCFQLLGATCIPWPVAPSSHSKASNTTSLTLVCHHISLTPARRSSLLLRTHVIGLGPPDNSRLSPHHQVYSNLSCIFKVPFTMQSDISQIPSGGSRNESVLCLFRGCSHPFTRAASLQSLLLSLRLLLPTLFLLPSSYKDPCDYIWFT